LGIQSQRRTFADIRQAGPPYNRLCPKPFGLTFSETRGIQVNILIENFTNEKYAHIIFPTQDRQCINKKNTTKLLPKIQAEGHIEKTFRRNQIFTKT
jgi:hypothetical protein